MKVLVTGATGFIGAALCRRLLNEAHEVIGVDNFSDVLDPSEVKRARLVGLASWRSWSLAELDISTDSLVDLLNSGHAVVSEAAVPGLLPSWDSFESYSHLSTLGVHRIPRDLTERPYPTCCRGIFSPHHADATLGSHGRLTHGPDAHPE